MSSTAKQANLTTVKQVYDAFSRGAMDEVLATMSEDIEWVEAAGGPLGGVYHGPDAVLENVFAPTGTDWDEFAVEPERYVEDGSTIVTIGTYRVASGGATFEIPFAHLLDMADGKLVRFQQYSDTARLHDSHGE